MGEREFVYRQTEGKAAFPSKLLRQLDDQRQSGELCDVELVAQHEDGTRNVEIPAHKNVLAACSPYFHAMFLGGMAETTLKKVPIQMSHTILLAIVMYFYSGVMTISADLVRDLVDAANYFHLDALKNQAGEFLVTTLSAANCLDLLAFADKYSLSALRSAAWKHACRDFKNVSLSPAFVRIPADLLRQVIAADDLHVQKEEIVFDAVMRWIGTDPSRKLELHGLMSSVRLPNLHKRFLLDAMKREADPVVRDLYSQTIEHWLGVGSCGESSIRPRPSYHSSYSLPWQTTGQKWTAAPKMLQKRKWFNAVSVDGKIFAVGGNDGQILASAEVLDTSSRNPCWSSISPLPTGRDAFGVCSSRGIVYVAGGITAAPADKARQLTRSVSAYDPAVDRWTPGPSLRLNRCESLAALDGVLYSAGSSETDVKSPSVECCDPRAGEWQPLAPMLVGRSRPPMAALNGKIYAFGVGGDKTIESYDVRAGRWTLEQAEIDALSGFRVTTCGDRIVLTGSLATESRAGSGKTKILSDGRWTDGPEGGDRAFHGFCAVGETLFCLGGYCGVDGVSASVDCLALGLDDDSLEEM